MADWKVSFVGIEKMIAEMQEHVDSLAAHLALPETLDATELALMGEILRLQELRGQLTECQHRHESLRHHWAKLRKAQLEAALAPPAPTTEKSEVSGEGPIPTRPDAENQMVDDKKLVPVDQPKEKV